MENKTEQVVAITVTYNRTRTLKRCLEALLNQTRAVNRIIVVDNHSCEEELEQIHQLVAQDERIQLLELEENRGGAGGFMAGMDLVRSMKPDWYWIMDDDAYPRQDCLEKMLEQKEEYPEAGGFCPAIYGVDLQAYQLFHHKKLSPLILKTIPVTGNYDDLKEVTELDANAFVGPLFSGKTVETMGIADGSLFIYGDDTEYTYRVSRQYPLFLVKSAVIDHQDAPVTDANMKPEGWWKEYYGNRNQFFMIREFHKNMAIRITAYGCLTVRLMAIMVKTKLKGYHKLRNRLICASIKDGLMNRRGKTLDPQKYFVYLKEKQIQS